MTPHELAEKIVFRFEAGELEDIRAIEALLTEFREEVKLDAFHTGGDRHMCEEALKRAKAKAMFDNTIGDDDTDRRIKEAVQAEREACAKVADEYSRHWEIPGREIAAQIRARGEHESPGL